jgi:hypothetical protein
LVKASTATIAPIDTILHGTNYQYGMLFIAIPHSVLLSEAKEPTWTDFKYVSISERHLNNINNGNVAGTNTPEIIISTTTTTSTTFIATISTDGTATVFLNQRLDTPTVSVVDTIGNLQIP